MGTCHTTKCNEFARKVWVLCEKHGMWLTAHIPGAQNIAADYDIEWMLNPKILEQGLQEIAFAPTIDLFASRLNKQFMQCLL